MARRTVMTMLILAGLGTGAAAEADGELHVSFAIPMQEVQAALEAAIPRNIERLGATEFHGDIGVRYGAWRTPFRVVATGHGIRVTTRIEFAAWGCLRITRPPPLRGSFCQPLASCGFDNQPHAVVDVAVDVIAAWNSDWSVAGSATMQSTTVRPCNVTFVNIDATPLAVNELRGQIERHADEVRERLRLRPLVESAWRQLAPIALGNDTWLVWTPRAIHVRPLQFQPAGITSAGTIAFDVSLVTSASPPAMPAMPAMPLTID